MRREESRGMVHETALRGGTSVRVQGGTSHAIAEKDRASNIELGKE